MAGKTHERKPLPKKQEARLDAVAAAFNGDETAAKWAVRYGRKLMKVEAGLRTTPAPIPPELGKESAAKVAEILGVDVSTHRQSAKKATTERRKATPPAPIRKIDETSATKTEAKPDPKPQPRKRAKAGAAR